MSVLLLLGNNFWGLNILTSQVLITSEPLYLKAQGDLKVPKEYYERALAIMQVSGLNIVMSQVPIIIYLLGLNIKVT